MTVWLERDSLKLQMKVGSAEDRQDECCYFICTMSVAGSKGERVDLLSLRERSGWTCSQNRL